MKKNKNKKTLKLVTLIVAAVVLVAIAVVVIVSKIPPKVVSLSEKGMPVDGINLIADRGFSAYAPENTDDAFIEAGKAKFYGAKCDIHLTKDEIWIASYDSSVNRMTNGTGEISQLTFGEIRKLKVNNGYRSGSYKEAQIINLDGFLIVCEMYNLVPYIEIGEGNYKGFDRIFQSLDNYEGMREKAKIISSDKGSLLGLRELDKNIELWYHAESVTDENIKFCKENGFTLYFDGTEYVEKEGTGIEKAQEAGINLACWTDDLDAYKTLYDKGIRNFATTRFTK